MTELSIYIYIYIYTHTHVSALTQDTEVHTPFWNVVGRKKMNGNQKKSDSKRENTECFQVELSVSPLCSLPM